LRDTSAPIRKVALTSLGAKAQYHQRYGSLSSRNPDNAIGAIGTIGTIGAIDWLTHFQPLTLDLNLEVAIQAVIAIARLSSEAAIETLLNLLQSPLTPQPQALATVRALLQNPNIRTIDALLAAFPLKNAPHPPETLAIVLEIMRGLGRLREPNVTPDAAILLVNWCEGSLGNSPAHSLADYDPTLLQMIAYSLGNLGNLGESVGRSWLDRLSSDPRDRVRITAIDALRKLEDKA
jgi:HEAT repeat protein